MIKDKEIIYLTRQYCDALGIEYNPKDYKLMMEASKWTYNVYKESLLLYKKILLKNGVNPDEKGIIEIGKSLLDTLTTPLSETTIVSPYVDSMVVRNDKRTKYNGNLIFDGMFPYIYNPNNDKELRKIALPSSKLIMLQNCDVEDLHKWRKLIFIGRNVVAGVYGSNDDKNKERKLAEIKPFAEYLIRNNYKSIYAEDSNSYALVLKRY